MPGKCLEAGYNHVTHLTGRNRSSTMSLRSSIYGNVVENGRTYHRYKEGSECTSIMDLAVLRLTNIHSQSISCQMTRLVTPVAPKDNVPDQCTLQLEQDRLGLQLLN